MAEKQSYTGQEVSYARPSGWMDELLRLQAALDRRFFFPRLDFSDT
jgi:hypothetical protein